MFLFISGSRNNVNIKILVCQIYWSGSRRVCRTCSHARSAAATALVQTQQVCQASERKDATYAGRMSADDSRQVITPCIRRDRAQTSLTCRSNSSEGVATDHCQGRNLRMVDSPSYSQPNPPPNQSQRSRSSATANDVSSAIRRIAKCGMRNLQPSCDYHQSSGFTFVYGWFETIYTIYA